MAARESSARVRRCGDAWRHSRYSDRAKAPSAVTVFCSIPHYPLTTSALSTLALSVWLESPHIPGCALPTCWKVSPERRTVELDHTVRLRQQMPSARTRALHCARCLRTPREHKLRHTARCPGHRRDGQMTGRLVHLLKICDPPVYARSHSTICPPLTHEHTHFPCTVLLLDHSCAARSAHHRSRTTP
jgi:hypothetical protein